MSILWTIIIGFVAGVIAKFIMPGDTSRPALFSPPYWASSGLSSQHTLARRSDGMAPGKGQELRGNCSIGGYRGLKWRLARMRR